MRLLNHKQVFELLSMDNCIRLMGEAFRSKGIPLDSEIPERTIIMSPQGRGGMGVMPAYSKQAGLGIKVATVFRGNRERNLSTHQGVVLLFDSEYGVPLACVDATAVTALRTAATAALATQILSRPSASRLCVLGTGTQSLLQVQAISRVRSLSSVNIFGRTHQKAITIAKEVETKLGIMSRASRTVGEAVEGADIISTVTASPEPILSLQMLPSGTHINAMGASRPGEREIPSDVVQRAKLFVDSRFHALLEAEEILTPVREQRISQSHIKGELSELLHFKVAGRENDAEITLYKSVGNAIQDVFVVRYLYEAALRENCGTKFELGATS